MSRHSSAIRARAAARKSADVQHHAEPRGAAHHPGEGSRRIGQSGEHRTTSSACFRHDRTGVVCSVPLVVVAHGSSVQLREVLSAGLVTRRAGPPPPGAGDAVTRAGWAPSPGALRRAMPGGHPRRRLRGQSPVAAASPPPGWTGSPHRRPGRPDRRAAARRDGGTGSLGPAAIPERFGGCGDVTRQGSRRLQALAEAAATRRPGHGRAGQAGPVPAIPGAGRFHLRHMVLPDNSQKE
jgi:hypothetical protein